MGKRVALIIDDEPDYGKIIEFCMKDLGFETLLAASGEEGLRKAREMSPDVVTMDILMPQEDGIDVIRKMGDDMHTMDIPIVVITVLEDRCLKKELEKNDRIIGYLTKPINISELEKVARKICKRT
jgi:CheY-like chemotaxis protein